MGMNRLKRFLNKKKKFIVFLLVASFLVAIPATAERVWATSSSSTKTEEEKKKEQEAQNKKNEAQEKLDDVNDEIDAIEKEKKKVEKQLKEFIGHTPLQVLCGAILGIVTALIIV